MTASFQPFTAQPFCLVGTLQAATISCLERDYNNFNHWVDIVEWRLDTLQNIDWFALCALRQRISQPLILTYRTQQHGGQAYNDGIARHAFWRKAVVLRPDYIDLEDDLPHQLWLAIKKQLPQCRLIRSCHLDFEDLNYDMVAHHLARDGNLIKIVCHCHDACSVARFYQHWAKHLYRDKTIALITGEGMSWSRWLAATLGVPWIYTAMGNPHTPIAGQTQVADWISWREYFGQSRPQALFALLGNPVDHSIGDQAHNAWFHRAQPYPAVYLKIPLKENSVAEWIEQTQSWPFYGYSITRPLKGFSWESHLNAEEPLPAVKIPINTLTRLSNHHWRFDNTDWLAIQRLIHQRWPQGMRHGVITGSGQTAWSCYLALVEQTEKITIICRSHQPSWAISTADCQVIRLSFDDLQESSQPLSCDVWINTIPDTMSDERIGLLNRSIVGYQALIDLCYQQTPTKLVAQIKALHACAEDGLDVWYYQALEQQALWRRFTDLGLMPLDKTFAHRCFMQVAQNYRLNSSSVHES